MSNEEAIKHIEQHIKCYFNHIDSPTVMAFNKAIDALENTACRNNLINEVVRLDMSREDKFKVMDLLEKNCEKCKHYLFTDIDGYYCEHETYGQPCSCEPKTVDAVEVVRCRNLTDEELKHYHDSIDKKARTITNVFSNADVVEVVRCKECKRWTDMGEPWGECRWSEAGNITLATTPDDYCSNGVRK